jgi:ectoine hydroxylase-related dioxygenase (phytanoyl-CoA dioxygenase family)
MSAVISKPGSNDQSIHSDISCDINSDLISCFVAMQKITLENGPTYLYSESHTNDFHKYRDSIVPKSPQSTSTYYNNDGSLDEEEQQPRSNDDELLNIDIDLRKKNEMINTSNPVAATLDIGDILIFNAKIFHFGSANISTVDRLLMSFSFQKLDLNGDYIPIKGFTYHLSNSMKNENKILKHYPNIE